MLLRRVRNINVATELDAAAEVEGWEYFDCGALECSRSGAVCMTCDHFRYACTKQCITLLTCPVHQKLINQGEHLNMRCKQWIKRRELEAGWAQELA